MSDETTLYRTATRTHTCGELRAADEGGDVVLCGWVDRRRDQGGILFVDLRDRYGRVQIVVSVDDSPEAHATSEGLSLEDVVRVEGRVRLRPEGTRNPKLGTGDVEVVVKGISILGKSDPIPFEVSATASSEVGLETRLRHRVVDLRRPLVQERFLIRHKVTSACRRALERHDFVDIETPTLTRSTPEGARDFVVPNRRQPGTFYALPQSPQLFKQLLMVAGFDRYFQVVKCFRDEDMRADRQPEFTQLDMEMAFVEAQDVQNVVEDLLADVFRATRGVEIERPFRRLPYAEAMSRYGSDKPDLRFGLEIQEVSAIVARSGFGVFTGTIERGGIVGAIRIEGGAKQFTRKDLDKLPEVVKDAGAKGVAWAKVEAGPAEAPDEGGKITGPLNKHVTGEVRKELLEAVGAGTGDLVLFIADQTSTAQNALGVLRNHLGEKLELIDPDALAFCWVVDFPLFEVFEDDDGQPQHAPMHHPFTMPVDEDIPLLAEERWSTLENKGVIRAKAYDVVLNGMELGGGSIRIHDRELQARIFSLLGISDELAEDKFGFLLRAFRYGAPPHGGIALGIDRLVQLVLKLKSIQDVIAFPKTHGGSCLLTGAPAEIDGTQLTELALKIQAPPAREKEA